MMAVVRHSQNYQETSVSNSVLIPSVESSDAGANGIHIRQRSDSAGSRGSVDNGQSLSSQSQFGEPGGPVLLHSSSSPGFTSGIPGHYQDPGPNTAPPQTEGFSPFRHRQSIDYLENVSPVQYNYFPGPGNRSTAPTYPWPARGMHTPGVSAPIGTTSTVPGHTWTPCDRSYGIPQGGPVAHLDSSNSRPEKFEQKFPLAPYSKDVTFLPESPSRTGVGPGTPTHVLCNQSPATTPPRQTLSWEPYSPVTPPAINKTPPTTSPGYVMYHTPSPPSSSQTDPSTSITFVSQISKYIGPQAPNDAIAYHAPPSINIQVETPSQPPFRMTNRRQALGEQQHIPQSSGHVIFNMPSVPPYTGSSDVATCTIPSPSPNRPNLITEPDRQMDNVLQLHQTPTTDSSSLTDNLHGKEDTAYIECMYTADRTLTYYILCRNPQK